MHDLNLDSNGNLWIADSKNNLVRVLFDPAHAPAVGAPAAGQPPAGTARRAAPAGGRHGAAAGPGQSGYWMLGNDGKIFPFGDATSLGDPSATLPAGTKAVHIEPTPTTKGYWIIDEDGDVYAYGDATHPAVRRRFLRPKEKVTSLSATPTGQGLLDLHHQGPGLHVRRRQAVRRPGQARPQRPRPELGGHPHRQGLLHGGLRRRRVRLR